LPFDGWVKLLLSSNNAGIRRERANFVVSGKALAHIKHHRILIDSVIDPKVVPLDAREDLFTLHPSRTVNRSSST
jgi:hypothetical protein